VGLVGVAALCGAAAIVAFGRLARHVLPDGGATTAALLSAFYPAAGFMLLAGCVVAASVGLMVGGAFLVGAGYHMT
jgi:hypothetical protein